MYFICIFWNKKMPLIFRKFYGRYGDLIQQYEVSLSWMLNDILILDQQWLPNQSDFPPISWPWYRPWPSPIMSGFHGAFATGVACQQGTLTDTWFRPPFWDLLMLQLLRPNSSNLPCLYSTFHLEYPLVLSRFCFDMHRTMNSDVDKGWAWVVMVATLGIQVIDGMLMYQPGVMLVGLLDEFPYGVATASLVVAIYANIYNFMGNWCYNVPVLVIAIGFLIKMHNDKN